jgi:hypothetical protein
MPRDIGSQLEELLSSFQQEIGQAQKAPAKQPLHTDEEYLVRIAKILIWLAGLSSCFILAWRASGESLLLTVITLSVPLLAWHLIGLWSWGLLLPLSLLGLLALQGAILLW